MAWIEKMNRAKAYMEDDWRAANSESVYSVSDDDDTLPGDDADDCFSDDASSLWSYPHPRRDADPVQLSLPFRLGRDEDPAKPVYEGWVIHVPPDEEDATEGCRVLGMKTAQKYRRMPGTPSALFTTHTQEELAAMHLEALDSYHGSRRSSGGCLPLRRLVRRHTSRKTYDDDVDARIRKLSGAVQLEISNLLQDRGRCCSTATRKREFTVAVVREQLHHRFASVEPTAARRHRLRWWKDNTRGSELQYFVVIVGRQTQHEPAGLPAYTRLTNPWRDVDRQQAVLERNKKRIEREKAGFFAPTIHTRRRSFTPPYLRRRAPLAHEPERSREPIRVRIHSRSRERSRSRSRDPPRWTARDRSRSPYRERSRSPYSDRSRSPSRERHGARFHMGPPPSRCYAGPAPPLFGQPSYVPYPHRPGPPLHPPGLPMHLRYPYPARPPVFAPTMMAPPPAPPPQPHPSAFFPTSYVPPSTSWPPSPHSYRHSPPTSSYGPPPPLMNPLSALTTPSSLGSFRVPMFGPIPPPPPPPPPRSASDKASRPGSPTGASSPDFGENAFNARSFAKPPPRPYVEDGDESENEEDDDDDEEQDTLVGLTPIVEEMVDDVSGCRLELKCPEATARDAAKLLAKDKPGMHDDD